jgi:hypothetical protein
VSGQVPIRVINNLNISLININNPLEYIVVLVVCSSLLVFPRIKAILVETRWCMLGYAKIMY